SAQNERIIPGRARSPTRRSPTKVKWHSALRAEDARHSEEMKRTRRAGGSGGGGRVGGGGGRRGRGEGGGGGGRGERREIRRREQGRIQRALEEAARGGCVPDEGQRASEPTTCARHQARERPNVPDQAVLAGYHGIYRWEGARARARASERASERERGREGGREGRLGDADQVEGLDEAQPRSVGARGATGGEPSLRHARQKRGRLLRGSDEDGRCARDPRAETGETDREQDVDRRHTVASVWRERPEREGFAMRET
ncbi:hypothetical protein ALC60_10263, partial [Trachymyrmex zeteki]